MKINFKKNIALIVLILIILIAYKQESKDTDFKIKNNLNTRVAIIFNEAGLGDKAFNDLCYDGVLKAQEDLGVEFDYSQSKNKYDYEKLARRYSQLNKYDLIISVGGEQESAVKKVSKEFPNQKFTIIDSKINLPNVSSINTKWEQQAFLNGVIAGLELADSKDSSVGVILGKNLDYLNEGAIGFEAGVKYINPNINVMKAIIGDFSDPSKAKEIALSMYNKGAMYIQQLAGQSGIGVFLAAKEVNKYAFGVDSNQNSFAPNNIVSTATRKVNDIIFNEIAAIKYNNWHCGIHTIGLDEYIIDYTTEGSTVKLREYTIKNVNLIKYNIINKKLDLPKNSEELNLWIKSNRYKLNTQI